MTEIVKPGILETPKKRRGFRAIDIGVFILLAVVIIALLVTTIGKLRLKHEVSAARVVTDRVVSDIAKQDASDTHSIGSTSFQAKHSTAQLSSLFTSAQSFAAGTPTIVHQTVANSKQADTVYIIYKYTGKNPYYIRIAASQAAGSNRWQLVGISGNNAETLLIVK